MKPGQKMDTLCTSGQNKIVLITGITGQDGSIMADFLLQRGYTVHGLIRRASDFNTKRIEHILDRVTLHYGDVTDMGNVLSIISKVEPDEIYNFAAMSHVKVSFELENYTFQANTLGILNILQSVRLLNMDKTTRIYHASTSEQYGNVTSGDNLLKETSPMIPVSPYGIAKLAAYHLCNYYRDAYNMFVVTSVLLNHEGERRGPTFVTKKIADYVGRYNSNSHKGPLLIGNLEAQRDWGYALDYMEGVWMMMHHTKPDNYVLATGETHSVREFAELAFKEIGVDVEWRGEGIDEYGVDKSTGTILIKVDPKYYRPLEIHTLIGDASKAKNVLGWQPRTSFKSLVKLMVAYSTEHFKSTGT